eukprot:scaffold19803_cov64-Phaeocystis_antarctica.AAC.2
MGACECATLMMAHINGALLTGSAPSSRAGSRVERPESCAPQAQNPSVEAAPVLASIHCSSIAPGRIGDLHSPGLASQR